MPHPLRSHGMRLDCGHCIVRDWARSDKPSLLRVANDSAVWRNLTHKFPYPYTEDDAERWFDLLDAASVRMHWAIEVDGEAVGGIGAEPGVGVDARSAHFGYWLGRAYWGRGIMSAACRASAEYVLAQFDIARLEARVFAWNPASMRVLEKSGFEREGLLRRSIFKDGQLIDAVLYARLR